MEVVIYVACWETQKHLSNYNGSVLLHHIKLNQTILAQQRLYAGKIWRQKHEKLRRTGCAIACVPNDLNVLVFRDFLFFVCVGNEYRGREKVVGVVNEFEISKTEMLFCILVIRNG